MTKRDTDTLRDWWDIAKDPTPKLIVLPNRDDKPFQRRTDNLIDSNIDYTAIERHIQGVYTRSALDCYASCPICEALREVPVPGPKRLRLTRERVAMLAKLNGDKPWQRR